MIKFKKVLIILLFLTGICISVYGIMVISYALKCRNWKLVKGHVIGAMVREIYDLPKERETDRFVPDIAYEYKYKGISYFKQSIGYFPYNSMLLHNSFYAGTEDKIIDFIKRFPINSKLDIYVNPENPEESLLETDLKTPIFIPLFLGFLIIYLAFHMIFFGNKYLHITKDKTKET